MNQGRTVPVAGARFEVPSLHVEVIDGPDKGRKASGETESISIGTANGNDLTITDPTVSRFHLQLSVSGDGVVVADQGSTNGTFAGVVRIERAIVPPGSAIRIGHTTIRVGRGEHVSIELLDEPALGGIVGSSPEMRRLMAQVKRAANADTAVLVIGESGTGKELIARALHELGPRVSKPLVTVDCGALAPTLVASELFGHERGAFTGADRQHIGAFERAEGGTLFLDEIGELPAPLQATLLGVLERKRFRRLGGTKEINVDVRVVSATHRDLRADVNANTFRLDLYYRLAVVTLRVPALRERPDDIARLVEYFLRECGHAGPVEDLISSATMKALVAHRWPGNVRELRNMVEATVAMGETPAIERSDEQAKAGEGAVTDLVSTVLDRPYKEARAVLLNDFERRYIGQLLERTGGNVSKASRESQLDRSHLTELIRRHGLK